jgi:hypothetical protein
MQPQQHLFSIFLKFVLVFHIQAQYIKSPYILQLLTTGFDTGAPRTHISSENGVYNTKGIEPVGQSTHLITTTASCLLPHNKEPHKSHIDQTANPTLRHLMRHKIVNFCLIKGNIIIL